MSGFRLKFPVRSSDHYLGNLNAPITIVEYADFEAPECAKLKGHIDELMLEFPERICFVFRQFPLGHTHPNAEVAALAAEAAALQSRFWAMHDVLLENQKEISVENIFLWARLLKLDARKLAQDMEKIETLARIHFDFSGGVSSGVNAVPTLFINSIRFEGRLTYESLKLEIKNELMGQAKELPI